MNEKMSYYIEIDGKPKCEFDYPDGWVPLLVTCSYATINEANVAKSIVEGKLPKSKVKVVQGVCPAYLEYINS